MAIKTFFEIGARDKSGKGVKSAKKNFKDLGKAGKNAGDEIAGSFKSLAGPLLAAVSATQALTKLVSVSREFDVLNAQLTTATGSAEGASVAFEAIQEFAANTPYDLRQVTEGFVQLKNLGLTPSERALTSYGNTASAMGKDLNQMIEAVADASVGEFERLKEFGIRSQSQGDKVSFTFRGVKTTIGKNSEEIQKYLIGLGENEFAGAMEDRVNTLDGAISNLGDSWDKLFLNLSEQGAGSIIEDGVRAATAAIDSLNEMLSSGELEARMNAFIGKFERMFQSVDDGAGQLSSSFETELGGISEAASKSVDAIIGAFENMPENITAMTKILVIEFIDSFEKLKVYATQFKDSVIAIFTDDTVEAAGARAEKQLESLEQVRSESIAAILKERDASIKSYDDQILKAKELGEQFKLNRVESEGDRLGQFGSDTGEKNVEEDPEVIAARERIAYLKLLKDAQIATDAESEEHAYLRRMEMLRARFEEGEIPTLEAFNRLKEQVEQKHQDNLSKIEQEALSEREKWERMSLREKTKHTFSELASITAGVAQHNKALFNLNKAAGIANAIINAHEGASKSLTAYPWPLAGVMAAAHLAAGMARVSAISQTSFGSKNSGATSVGGAPVTTAPSNIAQIPQSQGQSAGESQQQVTNLNINIEEDGLYSGRTVRRIMEEVGRQTNLNVRYG